MNLLPNIYSIFGDIYHSLGDNERAYEAFDSCLIYRPEDAMVLNNYAYYLSLDKKDLERAEEMSAKSLEIEPGNPTYLDTYAWILFQQKKYPEAQVYIDSVLVMLGDSLTADDENLLEHAGDIYYKAGNKSKALDLWRQALELSDKEPSKALEQKLRKKKYIE
jgi:Tfp pilus assembly protein PilF